MGAWMNIIVLIFASQPAWYICVYFLNSPELDGKLAWWRAALTIFTSYVNWNYYKLHTRCFFSDLCDDCSWVVVGTQWGVRRCIIRLAVPRTRESYLPALHLSDPRYCSPVPTGAALLPPKSQSKPKWVTCQPHEASSSSSENIELSPVSGNDDDTGDKFALQADVNDKETLQNLRIHTWSMNIESAYLEVKLTIWT